MRYHVLTNIPCARANVFPSPLRIGEGINLFGYRQREYFANMSRRIFFIWQIQPIAYHGNVSALERRPDLCARKANIMHKSKTRRSKNVLFRFFLFFFFFCFHRYHSPFESCEIGKMRWIRAFRVNAALKPPRALFKMKLPRVSNDAWNDY